MSQYSAASWLGLKPSHAKEAWNVSEFVFFNVRYEDGSQRSNRRVPSELLGGLDGDKPARRYILQQDREITYHTFCGISAC